MSTLTTQEPSTSGLVLVPDLSEVSRARAFVSSAASRAGFGEEKIFDITVACSEAIANAIEHSPVKGKVQVTTGLRADRLDVLIQGPGEFQTPDRLKERTNRGMGLPLMAKLSDHLAMYSNPEGGTLVTLTFYLPGALRQRQYEPLPPFVQDLIEDSKRLDMVLRAEEEAATSRRRAELMADTAAQLLASHHPQELVEPLCRRVMNELDCDVFFNFLVDEEKGRLHLNAYAGIPPEEAQAIRYLDFGVAVCGCAAREAKPIAAANILSSSDPRVELVKSYGVQAYAAHPLMADGRVIGTLSFGSRSVPEFNQDDLDLMWGMANTVAAAMNRIQIEAALRDTERKYGELISYAPSAIFEIDFRTRRLTAVNDAMCTMSGYSREELHAIDALDILTEKSRRECLPRMSTWLGGDEPEKNVEYEVVNRDGSVHLVVFDVAFTRDKEGRPAGALVIGRDITERRRAEEALRESESRYRALAAENERLYRQQLDIAENLQFALLNIPSEIGPLRIGHLYRSATEAARVGGDFYDVFEVKDGKVAMLIGDVCGHGIRAARTATLVKDVVHAFVHRSLRPHQVLRRANALLVEKDLPGFVTLFVGVLDTEKGVLQYASAGHPEALLSRLSGEIMALGTGSSPLGVYADAKWKTHQQEFATGDLMLLYTDGVIETRRRGEFFGQERLQQLMRRKEVTAEALPHLVLDRVLAFSNGTLTDDIAVLAVLFNRTQRPRLSQRNKASAD